MIQRFRFYDPKVQILNYPKVQILDDPKVNKKTMCFQDGPKTVVSAKWMSN
jgi:hypothetical protein